MSKLAETLKRVLSRDFKDASDDEKRQVSREIIGITAITASTVSLQPVPFIDPLLVLPLHALMVQAIARIHGYSIDKKAAAELVLGVGTGYGTRAAAKWSAKLIPGWGTLATLGTTYALTDTVGEMAYLYFRSGRTLSPDELKKSYEAVVRGKSRKSE